MSSFSATLQHRQRRRSLARCKACSGSSRPNSSITFVFVTGIATCNCQHALPKANTLKVDPNFALWRHSWTLPSLFNIPKVGRGRSSAQSVKDPSLPSRPSLRQPAFSRRSITSIFFSRFLFPRIHQYARSIPVFSRKVIMSPLFSLTLTLSRSSQPAGASSDMASTGGDIACILITVLQRVS